MVVLGWAWLAARKLNILSKQTAIYYGDYRGVRNGLKWRVTKGWTVPGASRRKTFWLQSPICPVSFLLLSPSLTWNQGVWIFFSANCKGYALYFCCLSFFYCWWPDFLAACSEMREALTFTCFSALPQKFSLAAVSTFQLLRKKLGLLPVFMLTLFSLMFHHLPSGSLGLLDSKMFLSFWCIYFNLAVSVAQQ